MSIGLNLLNEVAIDLCCAEVFAYQIKRMVLSLNK